MTRITPRQEYQRKVESQLMSFSNHLEKANGLADTIESDKQEDYYRAISNLRAKLESSNEWFEKIKNAEEDEWEEYREDMENSLKILKDTFDDSLLSSLKY